ncbi:zinc finger protein 708-like isoform X1 [Biomphalaria glabrata]
MDVLKQDFTTELKNIIKVEKIKWSSHSEMTENSFKSQTSKLILVEQTQNGNQEMLLKQDIFAKNTPNKDVQAKNFQSEEQNESIENKTYRYQMAYKGMRRFILVKSHFNVKFVKKNSFVLVV